MSPTPLIRLLESHRTLQFRRGVLLTAQLGHLVSPDEWTLLMRRYVNPTFGLGQRPARQQFNPRRGDDFAWESAAAQGDEFFAEISARTARNHWHRVLRAVQDQGILAVRCYARRVGVIAAPQILWDILLEWRRGALIAQHPTLANQLVELLPVVPDRDGENFRPTVLSASAQPRSVQHLFGDLHDRCSMAQVSRRRQPCALIAPLNVLGALRAESTHPTGWGDQALSWVAQQVDGRRVTPLLLALQSQP